MLNKTIMEQLKELPNDLSKKIYPLENYEKELLENFVKELEELTKKYNLSIHSWSNDGAWIRNETTNEEVCYNFRWNPDADKYEYKYESEDK